MKKYNKTTMGEISMLREQHDLLSEQTVDEVSRIFKVLADPTRIRILHLLSQEECCVNHIAEVLDLSQSAISHQLAYLRSYRLVKSRRQGKTVFYSCDDDHVISLLAQTIAHIQH
jgi:ArsR family transcriptional regulator, zinc-responsive transcriptional repressor